MPGSSDLHVGSMTKKVDRKNRGITVARGYTALPEIIENTFRRRTVDDL